MTNWTLARRAERMNPSVIREILKVTEKPGIISLAGGLPSPKTFPVSAFAEASAAVLANDGPAALQYAASEGFAPLRQAIADFLPWNVDPDQILITTGSQQALDLIAKVLIDESSRVLVETPTYLGALQAFTPMEPTVVAVASDDEGVLIDDLGLGGAFGQFAAIGVEILALCGNDSPRFFGAGALGLFGVRNADHRASLDAVDIAVDERAGVVAQHGHQHLVQRDAGDGVGGGNAPCGVPRAHGHAAGGIGCPRCCCGAGGAGRCSARL